MNTAQLKSKMRRLREEQEEEQEISGELNVIPYLDVVTNIVMFLLASLTTYQLTFGNLNITSPSSTGDGQGGPPDDALNLSVFVTEGGFTIAARGGQLSDPADGTTPTIKARPVAEAERTQRLTENKAGKALFCPEELQYEWEYPKLAKKLAEFKYDPQHPENQKEMKVILTANPGICYNVLVRTMDAVRRDAENRELFPDVILSAGVQ